MRWLAVLALAVAPAFAGDGVAFEWVTKFADGSKPAETAQVKASGKNLAVATPDGTMFVKDGVLTFYDKAENTHIVMDDAMIAKMKAMMAQAGMGGGAGGGNAEAYEKAKKEMEERLKDLPAEHRAQARAAMEAHLRRLKPKGESAPRSLTKAGTVEIDGETFTKYVVKVGDEKKSEFFVQSRADAGLWAHAIDGFQAWAKAMTKMPRMPNQESREMLEDMLKIDGFARHGKEYKDGRLHSETHARGIKKVETTDADFQPPAGSVAKDPFAGMGGGMGR